jgi:putative sigma-54 modulation protein
VQINISTRHGQLSEATREKIIAKVEKLSRYFERLTAISVTVNLEHAEDPVVELLVDAEHKHDFVATDQAGSLFGTLDNVVQKVEQQIKKYKARVQNHRLPGVAQLSTDAVSGEEASEEEEEASSASAEEE